MRAFISLVAALALSSPALAFGGLYSPATNAPSSTSIIVVDHADATVTSVVQLEYDAPVRNLAWVMPVRGKPSVSVSSKLVFQRLSAETAPQYWVEEARTVRCAAPVDSSAPADSAAPAGADSPAPANSPAPADSAAPVDSPASADADAAAHSPAPDSAEPDSAAPVDSPAPADARAPADAHAPDGSPRGDAASSLELGSVALLDRGTVAPYEYVTLSIDPDASDPSGAALSWLLENGFELPGVDSQVLRSYLEQGHNLVALKLIGDAALRPIAITYESDQPIIPTQPAALSGSRVMPLRVWVLGPSQAVPTNYASLVLNDALFDWLSSVSYAAGTLPGNGAGPFGPNSSTPSNYDVVVAAAADEAGGRGFVTELAEPASRFRNLIWSTLDREDFDRIKTQTYADSFEALVTAHGYYAEWDGWMIAVRGASTLSDGVSFEAFARDPGAYRGMAQVDAAKLFGLLEEHVIRPVADTAALLYRAPYITRFYTMLNGDAAGADPQFDYNSDLAPISNIHIARKVADCDAAQPEREISWRAELPQGGVVVGAAGEAWPLAIDTMPANLKVVMLSNRGPGSVVTDNSEVIRTQLVQAGGATVGEMPSLHPQPHGALIGGTQTVQPFEPPGPSPFAAKPSAGDSCHVARLGTNSHRTLAAWLLLLAAGMIWRLQRRACRKKEARTRRLGLSRHLHARSHATAVTSCRPATAPAVSSRTQRPSRPFDSPAATTAPALCLRPQRPQHPSRTFDSPAATAPALGLRPQCPQRPTRAFDLAGVVGFQAGLALLLLACSDETVPATQNDAGGALPSGALTAEQLRDPLTCKGCHPIHYREWSSSMHAYAAKDPVFLAMNRRGQRETNGALGSFCVKCHAPMALVDGRTEDGLNLEELPELEHGVSCYYCHNVAGVEGDHNGLLRIANDSTMRGPIDDPVITDAHRAEYSEFFEATGAHSSTMCGSCHDIVTPTGVHLERTFKEYRAGLFSKSATGEPPLNGTCVACHMPGRQGFAAIAPAGVQPRMVHEHLWPGIDVALIDFPNREAMRSAVEDCQLGQPSLSFFTLEVTPPDLFTFQLETNAGHNQPSGAAQDRRMWLEFAAYDEDGTLLREVSSGIIADDEIEEKPATDPNHDPHLLMFRDRIFDAQGEPVHMFWEAEKSAAYPDGYKTQLLPVATTTYIEGRHAVVKQYRASTADGRLPSRVTARLKIRPIGHDVLHDLIESGDLDPQIAAAMPTFTFGAKIDWTPADGVMTPVSAEVKTDCGTYRCLLDPSSPNCP